MKKRLQKNRPMDVISLRMPKDVIDELKSVQNMVKDHEVQLVNYLKGIKKDIGLLINFGPSGVEVKRKYREIDIKK